MAKKKFLEGFDVGGYKAFIEENKDDKTMIDATRQFVLRLYGIAVAKTPVGSHEPSRAEHPGYI